MPRPPSDSVQIAIRVPRAWLDEADAVARLLGQPGFEATRTDAFRAAIARGFEAIRADHAGQATAAPAPKAPKKASAKG